VGHKSVANVFPLNGYDAAVVGVVGKQFRNCQRRRKIVLNDHVAHVEYLIVVVRVLFAPARARDPRQLFVRPALIKSLSIARDKN